MEIRIHFAITDAEYLNTLLDTTIFQYIYLTNKKKIREKNMLKKYKKDLLQNHKKKDLDEKLKYNI